MISWPLLNTVLQVFLLVWQREGRKDEDIALLLGKTGSGKESISTAFSIIGSLNDSSVPLVDTCSTALPWNHMTTHTMVDFVCCNARNLVIRCF